MSAEKINRRNPLRVAVPMGAALKLSAGTTCGAIGCTSQVDFEQFAQEAFQTQRCIKEPVSC